MSWSSVSVISIWRGSEGVVVGEWRYEKVNEFFVLFDGDGHEVQRAESIAVLVDSTTKPSVLLKHGKPNLVAQHQDRLVSTFQKAGLADNFKVYSSNNWDLEELNKIIQITGYIDRWVDKFMNEEQLSHKHTPLIAGVGSREAPQSALRDMEWICRAVSDAGGYVRTGGARGCDEAAYLGGRRRSIIYLPDSKPRIFGTDHVWSLDNVPPGARAKAIQSVILHHPSKGNLPDHSIRLLARNWLILFGVKEHPVDAVVCWAEPIHPGSEFVKGGTGQTVRLAHAHNIPVFNLYHMDREEVLAALRLSCVAKEPA